MKECRCGRTIPKEWPHCAECLKYEALSPEQAADRTSRRQTRMVRVSKRRDKKQILLERLAEMRSAPEAQQAAILAIRRDLRNREANRAAKALTEWGSEV